jgi:sec-independent protein translocase protein TatB
MFDMGFAELLLVAVVGLLVIGPERLPGAIRTTMVWVNRIRRSFDEVRADVQRELHNDAVLRDLRESTQNIKNEVDTITTPLKSSLETLDADVRQGIESIGTMAPENEPAAVTDSRAHTDSNTAAQEPPLSQARQESDESTPETKTSEQLVP